MTADVLQGYPLSPQQKRLWLLKQSEDGQPYYVEGSLLIEGLLDRGRLQQAIEAVVREYEVLHTTFRQLQGMSLPLQVVGAPNVCWLPDCDLTACAEQEQRQQLQILAHTLASLSSDLEQDAVLRAVLAILSPNRHVLLINLPGLCADNRSLQTLTTLFYHQYRALEQGEQLQTDEPMQYALVAEWLNELLAAAELEAGRIHWQRQHVSDHLNTTFPFEDAPTHSSPFRPHIIERSIGQALSAQIEQYVQISQIPASLFFLTCWHVLLWQLTRQTELCISVTCDGRSTEDLIPVIGPLARSLPLLSHLEATMPFSAVLAQTQAAYQTAYEWQECFQGDLLAGEQQTTKDLSFLPISFEYIAPATIQGDSHLSLFLFSQRAYLDRFTLKLSCSATNDLFLTEFQYDGSRVSEDSVICLADSFSALLEDILQNPAASLETFLPLSAQAKTFLLFTLNDTRREHPENRRLPQIFEEQVVQHPERIAVIAQDLQVTYAELNRRANQLAHYLRHIGIRPGSLVGLCIERSLEMVVGLLGILKAGAAYVPLDPSYPKQRLAFMIEDAQVALLITRQDLLTLFPLSKQQIFCLDTCQEVLRSAPVANPQGEIASEMPAYVLYTSGSTGKPKGVFISHQALSNHMHWMQSAFPLHAHDSVLQKTPFSFDASIWEFYAPLLAGARLVIAEPERQQDSVYLIQEMRLQQISILQVVPMLLRMLLDNPDFATCQSLKRVFCGGETLSRALAQRVFACLDVELINLYGPTETTIETVVWSCKKEEKQVVVPIGHPIDNIEAYVLDTNLQLKPFFAIGELYLAGVGLAYGYLNRPELTAQLFIPHPFSTQPGARLYKTGDLARYRSDGAIECLGRADSQVKIRGFRVEIDEIVHNILQHPAIGDCVVLVQEVAPGVTGLIAYLVTSLAQSSITEIMRSYLAEQLAEYMIPDFFIVIEALPLL
ncbi:MAG TPA: amino acid adenylation domain-containing protein, partial [Ktedonobacteraceae bacterium]|nr:amino acid adenylation domain-containing protein [Ktedonobacteraceae bacterium]